jgi:transposase
MHGARRGYTTDLSDAEWAILGPLLRKTLKRQEIRGRPLELELRDIVDAIRYVLRNGV